MSDVYYTCQCLVCSLNDSILVKSTDNFFCNMYDEYIKSRNVILPLAKEYAKKS